MRKTAIAIQCLFAVLLCFGEEIQIKTKAIENNSDEREGELWRSNWQPFLVIKVDPDLIRTRLEYSQVPPEMKEYLRNQPFLAVVISAPIAENQYEYQRILLFSPDATLLLDCKNTGIRLPVLIN